MLESLFFGPKTCLFDIYKVVAERIEFEHDGRMSFVELQTLRHIQRSILSIMGEVGSVFCDISASHIVTQLEIYAHYVNQPSNKFLSTLGTLVTALESLARTLHTRHCDEAGGWRNTAYSTGKLLVACLIRLTNDFAVGCGDQATSFMGRRLMLNSLLALVCLAQTLMPMDRLTPWPTEWHLLPPSTSPLCAVSGIGIGSTAVPAADSIGIISRGFAYLEHYFFHRDAEVRALGFALATQLASTVPGREMLLKSFHRANWHDHLGDPMPSGGICGIALDALVDDDDDVRRDRRRGSSGGKSESVSTRCFAAKLLTTLNGFGGITERDLYGAQYERVTGEFSS